MSKVYEPNTKCFICEKPIHRFPVQLKKTNKHFCNRAHSRQHTVQAFKNKHIPNTKCCNCNKPIHKNPGVIESNRNVFCNSECCKQFKTISIEECFWRHTNKKDIEECWLWTGSLINTGYGLFSKRIDGDCIKKLAHRISYELHYGEIPEGKFIGHKCDVRACVNPSHLFLTDAKGNMEDMVKKGRQGRHKSDRLSDYQVYDIREKYYEHDFSCSELAKEYNSRMETIRRIVNYLTYEHI